MKLSYVQFLVLEKLCRNCKFFMSTLIEPMTPQTILDYGGKCTYMQTTADMLGGSHCRSYNRMMEYKKL